MTPTAWRWLGELRGPLPGQGEPLVLHLYVVTAWTGTPRNLLPEEHTELRWFSLAEACQLPLAHPTYPALFRRLVLDYDDHNDDDYG